MNTMFTIYRLHFEVIIQKIQHLLFVVTFSFVIEQHNLKKILAKSKDNLQQNAMPAPYAPYIEST